MSRGPSYHSRRARPRLLTGGVARPPRRELRRAHASTSTHSKWRLWRQLLGWIVIAWGLVAIILPLNPAILILPVGVALVGRQQPVIRWCRTRGKLALRWSAGLPGALGRCGELARRGEQRFSKLLRDRRLGPWHLPPKNPPTASPSA